MLYLLMYAYIGTIFGDNESIIKIPLLLADLAILFFLVKIFPHKKQKLILFYFLNPIIIYSIYIHSQLDIIPTALLFGSVYFLLLDKIKISSIFFGLALSTKFHVIIALPLVLFYLYKKQKSIKVVEYIAISFLFYYCLIYPF